LNFHLKFFSYPHSINVDIIHSIWIGWKMKYNQIVVHHYLNLLAFLFFFSQSLEIPTNELKSIQHRVSERENSIQFCATSYMSNEWVNEWEKFNEFRNLLELRIEMTHRLLGKFEWSAGWVAVWSSLSSIPK